MDINNEVENMNITTWKDADEATQDAMLKVLTESDNGEMVMCDNMTCETIITESGSYYEESLKSFMVDESIIDDEDDYDEDDVSVEITGIKFSDVVLYTNEVEDIDYNSETREITKLGTFSTQHTLYCSEGCAKREYRGRLMMKARHEAKK
jgi:hypothetical protein